SPPIVRKLLETPSTSISAAAIVVRPSPIDVISREEQSALASGTARAIELSCCGCNVKRCHSVIAERTVCRRVGRRMRLDDAARWGKDVDQRSRTAFLPAGAGDDMAFAVQTYPTDAPVRPTSICTKGVEHDISSQAPI